MIATEPDGRIIFWNDGAERLYGWTADEAIGRNIMDLTPADMSKPEAAEVMIALNQGQPWSGEFVVRTKDSAHFTVHVTDMPVIDSEGRLVGIVGLSRRVTYLVD